MKIVSEHRLRNELAELRQLEAAVDKFSRQAGLARPVQDAVDLALVEGVTNIIHYAWDEAGEHEIVIRFQASDDEVNIEIEDDGREYDPRRAPPVDVNAPLETRTIGGLGVHMIQQLMDRVDYRRENGRNILTLVKRRA